MLKTYDNLTQEAIDTYNANKDQIKLEIEMGLAKMGLDIAEGFSCKDGYALTQIAGNVVGENARFVEVGSWKGNSTSYLALVVKKHGGHIYCVDHWRGSPGVPHHRIKKDCFEIFSQNMRVLGYTNYITPMKMTSVKACKKFRDNTLDLVFIDADHRYKSIKRDIEIWWPKLKVGGVMCGHDAEVYYSLCEDKFQKLMDDSSRVDAILNDEKTVAIHPGVAKALGGHFDDKHYIINNTLVWYAMKDS